MNKLTKFNAGHQANQAPAAPPRSCWWTTYDPDDIVNAMRTRATTLGGLRILAAAAGALLPFFA